MGAPVAEGQVLAGKYRVEKILGQGGMGVVVAATHEQLQQRVAIKFLLPGASHEATQRFLREARAAVRLKSEHVARVSDVGELDDGSPYMVMEYLEGDDLSRIVRKRGPLPIEEAVTYVLHACEAIAEAHALGIVHRDLKPANLFLTTAADGTQTVKVLDFGISKTPIADSAPGSEPAVGLTQTEMMLGSPLYMAPEQMRSAKTVDTRADIWSLGGVLYQLLTSTVPFNTTSLHELILMIHGQEPTPPRTYRPDLPEELEAAILRCLRKPREERFASVGELAQALAAFAPVEEVARSVPRILRTLGMTSPGSMVGSRSSLSSISSGSYPAVSNSAAEAVARAVQATGAPSQAPGAVGPYASTTPSKPSAPPHAMTGPTMPSAGVVPPGASPSVVPPGASPSVAPPAVARTAQHGDPGQSSPPEPMPNAGTAAGWTAAGASRPPRSSSGGKVVALAAALLAVGGGAAFAVVQLGKPAAEPAPASPAAADIVAPPPVAPAPPPSATAEVTPATTATAPEPAPTASAAPSATAPEPAPTSTARTASRPGPSAAPVKTAAATTATPPTPATAPTTTPTDIFDKMKQKGLQ